MNSKVIQRITLTLHPDRRGPRSVTCDTCTWAVITAFSDSSCSHLNLNLYLSSNCPSRSVSVSLISSVNSDKVSVTSVSNMSYVAKGEKEYDAAGPVPAAKLHKIRITLTSSNVKNLEKCSCSLLLVSSAVLLTFSI